MGLVVIDSGGANLGSVLFALQRLGVDAQVSRDTAQIQAADRLILPGVGAAGDAMQRLRHAGLDQLIPRLQQPLLGICLGLQLLYEHSAEDDVACLGVFPGIIRRFPTHPGLRVPHMGWNQLEFPQAKHDPFCARLQQALNNTGDTANNSEVSKNDAEPPNDSSQHKIPWAYFVHSYYAPLGAETLAQCAHGVGFTAIARRGNVLAAQFHPERSAQAGAALLRFFLEAL